MIRYFVLLLAFSISCAAYSQASKYIETIKYGFGDVTRFKHTSHVKFRIDLEEIYDCQGNLLDSVPDTGCWKVKLDKQDSFTVQVDFERDGDFGFIKWYKSAVLIKAATIYKDAILSMIFFADEGWIAGICYSSNEDDLSDFICNTYSKEGVVRYKEEFKNAELSRQYLNNDDGNWIRRTDFINGVRKSKVRKRFENVE